VRTKNPETGETFTWQNAIRQILATPAGADDQAEYQRLMAEMEDLLGKRRRILETGEAWTSAERELGQLSAQWDDRAQSFSADFVQRLQKGSALPDEAVLQRISARLSAFPERVGSRARFLVRKWWWSLRLWRGLSEDVGTIRPALSAYGIDLPTPAVTAAFCDTLGKAVRALADYRALHLLHRELVGLQNKAKILRPLGTTLEDMEDLLQRVSERTSPLFLHRCGSGTCILIRRTASDWHRCRES